MHDTITIQVDARLRKILRSPWMILITTLQGIAVSFSPMMLFWASHGGRISEWMQWLYLISLYVVGWFYLLLGKYFIARIVKS